MKRTILFCLFVFISTISACGNGGGVGTTGSIVKSNGIEIGTLLGGDGHSYAFVNSDGYVGTINTVTGYLNYYVTPYYETNDCTGQEYLIGVYINYPHSIYTVYRGWRDTSKMYHTTTGTQTQRTILSYWSSGVCSGYNKTEWTQPVEEITEATSGIKLLYDLPITLEEN